MTTTTSIETAKNINQPENYKKNIFHQIDFDNKVSDKEEQPQEEEEEKIEQQQQKSCLKLSQILKNYKNIQIQLLQQQLQELKKQKIYLKYNAKYYKLFINYKQKYKNKLVTEHIYNNVISICYHKTYKFLINIKIYKLLIIKPFTPYLVEDNVNTEKINNDNYNTHNLTKYNYYNYYHKNFKFEYFELLDVMIVKFNNDDDDNNTDDKDDTIKIQQYNKYNEDDCWNIVKNSTFYEKKFVDFDEQKNIHYKNINLQFYWKNNYLQEIRILNFKESTNN